MRWFICGVLSAVLTLVNSTVSFPGFHEALRNRMRAPGTSGGGQAGQSRHTSRYPLYMMHLYRTFLTGDDKQTSHENPALYESDSVLSLFAKSEYPIGYILFLFFYL